MPTYDYECEKGHLFEAFQKMTDKPLKKCQECGSKVERKIGSGAGFIFKGAGFYVNDYKTPAKPSKNKDSDLKTTEKNSESKGDS